MVIFHEILLPIIKTRRYHCNQIINKKVRRRGKLQKVMLIRISAYYNICKWKAELVLGMLEKPYDAEMEVI